MKTRIYATPAVKGLKYVCDTCIQKLCESKSSRGGWGSKSQGLIVPCRGGGPRVVVSTAVLHARFRGSFPGLGGLKETKVFLLHPLLKKLSIVGSLRDRAYSASDLQGLNFESCVWRAVSSHSSHQPREVLHAQFSLYVHKGGLKHNCLLCFLYR